MNVISTVLYGTRIEGIHFDSTSYNLYVALGGGTAIYIYNTIDQDTFNNIATINTSPYNLRSITIKMDKIYVGTSNGIMLVFNKTSHDRIRIINTLCTSCIISVEIDCNEAMAYSCYNPPMVNIIETNGKNSSISLNGTFSRAYDTLIDSQNRLWLSGNGGFAIYV